MKLYRNTLEDERITDNDYLLEVVYDKADYQIRAQTATLTSAESRPNKRTTTTEDTY